MISDSTKNHSDLVDLVLACGFDSSRCYEFTIWKCLNFVVHTIFEKLDGKPKRENCGGE